MGCCMSSESSSSSSDYSSTSRRHRKPSANVVSLTGELLQYPLPVTVSQVLQSETSSSPDSFFICNSDRLYFDDYIPSLDAQEELESGQIYFVLPISKLEYRLAASDMAALAVKASVALEKINAASNQSRRNRKVARISPVLVSEDPLSDHNHQEVQIKSSTSSSSSSSVNYYRNNNNNSSASATRGLGVSRSGSVRRKLTRYSSRRAKFAVRSFRIKLNTIYEGSVLLLN